VVGLRRLPLVACGRACFVFMTSFFVVLAAVSIASYGFFGGVPPLPPVSLQNIEKELLNSKI
jgi:hypothetical protein